MGRGRRKIGPGRYREPFFFSFINFLLCFRIPNFKYSNQSKFLIFLDFRFPKIKHIPNGNLNSTVYHLIIYFPCHLFTKGINGSIIFFFLIFYFILGICPCVATEDTCARISHCLVMLLRINLTIITNMEVCHFEQSKFGSISLLIEISKF
jgi:hypothetical protein